MKRILLALLLFLSLQSLAQQQWIAQGSVWHYSHWSLFGRGEYKLEYNSDTIVNGKNCQKIASTHWDITQVLPPPAPPTVYPPVYGLAGITYNSVGGDTVFYLASDGLFYVLYNFLAVPGNTWQLKPNGTNCCNCNNVMIKVYGKGDTLINGQSLRWLDVGPNDSSSATFSTGPVNNIVKVIEKIGVTSNGYLFPLYDTCTPDSVIWHPDYYSFSCYNSPKLSLQTINDCDGLVSAIENAAIKADFSIFPNPSPGITNINLANLAYGYNLTVYDIAGRQLQVLNGLKGNYQLHTETLPKALYTIRIEQAGKLYYHKLLIN